VASWCAPFWNQLSWLQPSAISTPWPIDTASAPIASVLIAWGTAVFGGGDVPSKALNQGGIINTRHNMTQSFMSGAGKIFMDLSRNDYGEVCVYCHTPHGASTVVAAPLWNRTATSAAYALYNRPTSATVTQPGVNSLTCLSCHDGTVAIDSIINMPGSGKYSAAQASSQNNAFLNTWSNASGSNPTDNHEALNATGCLSCHNPAGPALAADFTVFAIGTDLTNDHPVGIRYPTTFGAGLDFKPPTATVGGVSFFDSDGNGRADPKNVRLYSSGEGHEVECASCHDPHGVPSGGPGSVFNPSFLRVANNNSVLCQTCHDK